jgi:DNA-binding winged helix-turn-helix (wHTH) protein
MEILEALENPYLQLSMVFDPDTFYGSSKLVSFLLGTVSESRPIAPIELLALPGMGKSTLLRFLAHPRGALALEKYRYHLKTPFQEEPQRLFPVLVEFRLLPLDEHPFLYLYEHFQRAYPAYRLRAQEALGRELPKLTQRSTSGSPADAIDLLKNDIRKLAEQGIRPILLLDDFDIAFTFKNVTRDLTTRLRPLRDFVGFIMAMERPLHVVNREAAGSPFFQNTPLLRLGGLTDDEARQLIEKPARDAGKPFPPDAVKFILQHTDGHPYLIILGGRALWNTRKLLGLLDGEDIPLSEEQQAVLYGHLEEEFARPFQLYWEKLEPNERDTLRVLSQKGDHKFLGKGHYKVLPALLELGLVKYTTKTNPQGSYELFSPLFGDFLATVAELPQANPVRQENLDLSLTGFEAQLYEYLRRHAGRVSTYEELWRDVWDQPIVDLDNDQMRRRMQVTVSRLRPKLQLTGEDIISIRDHGYRLASQITEMHERV